MRIRPVRRTFKMRLHDVIDSFHFDKGDYKGREVNHAMINVIVWAIDQDRFEEITWTDAIDAHFDGDLRDQLLAAIDE